MKCLRTLAALAAICVMSGVPGYAQQVSERKEIAVFNLSYYDWAIPAAALGAIDEQIRSVFIRIGRFDVIGLTQRLATRDVNEFIERIKDFKQRDVQIPERVLMGQEAFTERDFNILVGSFIVVVPAVSFYNLETLRDGSSRATIQTSFTFINVEEARAMAQFFVETRGSDRNAANAVKEAVDAIPGQLTFEIRRVEEFQIRSGIIEVTGGEVIFELGSDMGIAVGDEYSLISPTVVAGFESTVESGLLVVKEVHDRFSVARIIYADRQVLPGDQLREIPRIGVEALLYGAGYLVETDGAAFIPYVGVKAVVSRGFFNMRPVVSAEVPLLFGTLVASVFDILPLNISLGAELTNVYLGRFQVAPTLMLSAGGAYLGENMRAVLGTDEQFILTHLGGRAFLSMNFLFTRDAKITVDLGYAAYWGVWSALFRDLAADSYFNSKAGPTVAVGVTFK